MGSVVKGLVGGLGAMIGLGGDNGPKAPAVPMPPPAAHPATYGSAAVQGTLDTAQKTAKAAAGGGMDGTVKTSPQGLKAPTTAKTLLG